MALATLQTIAQIKQKARIDSARSPAVAEALRSLFKHLEQNPKDLAYIPFTTSGGADVVIADAACKVYAIVLKKRPGSTTAAWFKASNHASAAAANGDIVVALDATVPATKPFALVFHDGLPMGTGVTIASHTTVNGNTDSQAADSQDGYFLVGAP
jgi:hypothetical protein